MQHLLVSNGTITEAQFASINGLSKDSKECLEALFENDSKNEYLEMSSPDLTSDDRHYRAGRMAAIVEFESILESLY